MPNAWLMLAHGDERMYGGNEGYDDSPRESYAYDSFVGNHRRVAEGDVAVICGKDEVIGVGLIESVEQRAGTRTMKRCPVCGTAQSKLRKTKRPAYRCNNGHEFDEAQTTEVPCQLFVARYGRHFNTTPTLTVQQVRDACPRFIGQNAIQPIDLRPLREAIPNPSEELSLAMAAAIPSAGLELPESIDRETILEALKTLQEGVPHDFADSTGYDVYWDGRRYPPKAVVGVAARIQTGNVFGPYDFKGGIGSKCFRILERAGFDIITKGDTAAFPDEISEDVVYSEGAAIRVMVNKYERDRAARKRCIEVHGVICKVCGFDFESVYGSLGDGFVHVHHLSPVAEVGQEYQVDPVTDLIPVCPNCHAMLHKRTPPYTVAELKAIMASSVNAEG